MFCKKIAEQCIACGICQLVAPHYFDYYDEGIVLFKDEPAAQHLFIPANQESAVLTAIKKCPTKAIIQESDRFDQSKP